MAKNRQKQVEITCTPFCAGLVSPQSAFLHSFYLNRKAGGPPTPHFVIFLVTFAYVAILGCVVNIPFVVMSYPCFSHSCLFGTPNLRTLH